MPENTIEVVLSIGQLQAMQKAIVEGRPGETTSSETCGIFRVGEINIEHRSVYGSEFKRVGVI